MPHFREVTLFSSDQPIRVSRNSRIHIVRYNKYEPPDFGIAVLTVDTIMTRDLDTVNPGDTLDAARSIMRDRRIHHRPVVEDDSKLVGLVTRTDVLVATDSKLRDENERFKAKDIRIADVMNRDVVSVDEHAGLRQAALFLEKHKIGCLPVVMDGKLHGIITDTDFVAVAINLLEQIEYDD